MYFILIAAWLFYFFMHSFLADLKVKDFFYNSLSISHQAYRLLYNIFALGGLTALTIFSMRAADYTFQPSYLTFAIGCIMIAAGGRIMFLSAKAFDLPEFLGLKPFKESKTGAAEAGLIQTGLYRYVRHPLYSGTLLFSVGLFFIYPIIGLGIFLACMAVYIPVGIHSEEKKLIEEYGEEYLIYKKKVKSLIPGVL